MKKFDLYMADVRSQLECNATPEYKEKYITYVYSNETIESNLEYFEERMKEGLSAYKALLFFWDYLNAEESLALLDSM